MQTVLTFLVLVMAIGYALWRAYQTFRQYNDPCYGCSGCALKELRKRAIRQKADCLQKK